MPYMPYNARENVCFRVLSAMCALMPIVMGNAKANVCTAPVGDARLARRLCRLVDDRVITPRLRPIVVEYGLIALDVDLSMAVGA